MRTCVYGRDAPDLVLRSCLRALYFDPTTLIEVAACMQPLSMFTVFFFSLVFLTK